MRQADKIHFVERGCDEWVRMWDALDTDSAMPNPHTGEVWQYMGTTSHDGEWLHQFRHRNHPKTQKREYRQVPASTLIDWGKDNAT